MRLFSSISKKISEIRQKSRDKKEFFKNILSAAEDGILTNDEIIQLETKYEELGLKKDDLNNIRVQAYNTALKAVKKDGVVTAGEESELAKLQIYLKIPESEIIKSKKELAKLRLLTEIQDGNLPSVTVQNVIFQKNETAYWAEPASIIEERVISRRYEGGSKGLSFRIAKGLTYRVGKHRGHLVRDTAVIPVSTGELIITNKRVIFRGNAKSFSIRLDKLLELEFYRDGLRLTKNNGKPRLVKLASEGNSDVIGSILSYAINQC